MVVIREIVGSLQLAIDDQRQHAEDGDPYEEGYLDGLERAANVVVIKAAGLKTGVESER